MGHLSVRINYKPATNESTILVEQGNLTAEEYAKAIAAINEYLIQRVKRTGAAEDVADRFKLPDVIPSSYQFAMVQEHHDDLSNDLFLIFGKDEMNGISISINVKHAMEMAQSVEVGGKPVLLRRSPNHSMITTHETHFDPDEVTEVVQDYDINKSRFKITIAQGGKAVIIDFPKLLPPSRPFSDTRAQILVETLFKHLAKYKPLIAIVDQEEDAETHKNINTTGKVTLAVVVPFSEYRPLIMNLTRIVDEADKKIDERNKANAGAGTQVEERGPRQTRKNATATRVVLETTPIAEQVEAEPIAPKKRWSCLPF